MKTADEFGYPEVEKQAKTPLKDAAAVNGSMLHDGKFGVVLRQPLNPQIGYFSFDVFQQIHYSALLAILWNSEVIQYENI